MPNDGYDDRKEYERAVRDQAEATDVAQVFENAHVHTLPHFTRTELQAIGTRAHELAAVEGLNPEWRQVYESLAMAASILDAFLARAELPLVVEKYAPAGDKTGRPQNPQMATLWDWQDEARYDAPSEAH